jgi:hypothetical protein
MKLVEHNVNSGNPEHVCHPRRRFAYPKRSPYDVAVIRITVGGVVEPW